MTDVQQRHWSRIGQAREFSSRRRLFLKQSMLRTGGWSEALFSYEVQGHRLAAELLGSWVDVPRLLSSDRNRLLNTFEHVEMLTPDELLRSETQVFSSVLDGLLAQLHRVLSLLGEASEDALENLPRKHLGSERSPRGLCFKGLDIRNVGVHLGELEGGRPILFDFGRPYAAPPQEAAAKLFVSVGLLGWGRPLRRFRRGPELEHLELAAQHLGTFLDRESVARELAYQRRFRLTEIQASNRFEGILTSLAVRGLGPRYFRLLEDFCERRFC